MASYASYKKIDGTSFVDNSIPESKVSSNSFNTWNVKWIYGNPVALTGGCCCLWTVPSGVYNVYFELWGAGGNGHGTCSCNRCQHYAGAQGGYYNAKMINTVPGCQYTICAGGVYPCCQFDCYACHGCTTYINGYNLTNFCALGGAGGCANASWQDLCFSDWGRTCVAPGDWGGDFAMGNHRGAFMVGSSWCHCWCQGSTPTPAPFIGTGVTQQLQECWIRCGCWTVPYGHGGQGAMTDQCGGCCGQGGTGGPGLVKISYL